MSIHEKSFGSNLDEFRFFFFFFAFPSFSDIRGQSIDLSLQISDLSCRGLTYYSRGTQMFVYSRFH